MTAIVDTGPIVALLDAREPHHAWARDTLGRLETPLRTCEAVLSEVCVLLSGVKGGRSAVLTLVSRGIVAVDFGWSMNWWSPETHGEVRHELFAPGALTPP